MPIMIPRSLPAAEILSKENIFTMDEARALSQDIRPLQIAILNLMPTKEVTETQFLRLLSNTPLQLDITFLKAATHKSKNTAEEHLRTFYKTFSDIRSRRFDGLIITGAPVEALPFDKVDYWNELCEIMDWAKTNVYSTLFVCWSAHAGLYHRYGVEKRLLSEKISGVFRHNVLKPSHPLVRGFDAAFNAPHSRYSEVAREDIAAISDLTVLADSPEAGIYLIAGKNGREVFITGHSEYDFDTIKKEYERDLAKGISPSVPRHYFPGDDPALTPVNTWRAHAHLLYSNWLNYFVYQSTPYDINEIR